jgi:DNA (cytosine-5)-methyltransferase 1
MRHGSLFSGIGGFDLASEWMGWENVFHCEWNPFGQKVLNYYWPNAITYHDITKTDFTIHRGAIDIITGGFPCQPYSSAGKRLGKEDERHLWPEMLRAIREIQPSWVVGENVRGLTNWNGGLVFDEVQANLEAEGYEVTPFLLSAASVGAFHKRDRIWFIAYSKRNGLEYRSKTNNIQEKETKTFVKKSKFTNDFKANGSRFNEKWPTYLQAENLVCSGINGVSKKLDRITFPKWRKESIKAYGNAVVPQVVYQIFKAIEKYNELDKQLTI